MPYNTHIHRHLMTNLSPQAQAIIDAFYREVPPNYEQGGLVAALCVLADMEVRNDEIREAILSIATELKAN